MRYWLLIFLYVLLIIYYLWHPSDFVSVTAKWPLLQKNAPAPIETTFCTQSSDCREHQICLDKICVEHLLRGEECDLETGMWTLTAHRGHKFAACTCLNPHLVTQRYFGGNCDVDVACKPHGYWNVKTQQCVCPEDYAVIGTTCRKKPFVERNQFCEDGEIQADSKHTFGLDQKYLDRHKDKKCFKKPCTFDAMTGKPLKNARYERGVGCICDPTLGQFGIRIDTLNEYIRGPGFNACVSIYETPLQNPVPAMNLMAYFFLQKPITYLQYTDLNPERVIVPLRDKVKNGALQIGQQFPHDYMQFFFRKKRPFQAKIYSFRRKTGHLLVPTYKLRWSMKSNPMEWCRFMTRHLSNPDKIKVQELLYEFPVCYIGKTDKDSPDIYRGTFVSNPLHITFPHWPVSPRSNGVVLKYRCGEWTLDWAPDYKLSLYSGVIDNTPEISDPVIEAFANQKPVLLSDIQDIENSYKAQESDRIKNREPSF